jgi:hypothetical protein
MAIEPVSIYGMWACSNLSEMSRTMSISFMATSLGGYRRLTLNDPPLGSSLLRGTFTEELCDIEIHEVSVMKNDRFD